MVRTPAEEAGAAPFPARVDTEDELVCLGHEEDVRAAEGALAPPLQPASLFAQPTLDELMSGLAAEHRHTVYSRGRNPTVTAVEEKIARLERAESCLAFASGMAAIAATLSALVAEGDHVLFVNQTYGPTLQLARKLERFGVTWDLLLELDPASVESALGERTTVLWLESPGTMLFRLADVAALSTLARERGATVVMDNSWASPLFQKPLTAGVDLVVHSATKYLAGHSDLVAGVVAGSAERLERIFYDGKLLFGGSLSPFDAWLLNRGLRTLPVRMLRHHECGLAVARHLAAHPRVRKVFHPALAEPEATRERLGGCSGLFSFELDTESYDDLRRVVDGLRRFRIGVSWGGVESLVITPFRGDNGAFLGAQGIPVGTIRLSIGLESPEILIDDLDAALARL